MKITNKVVKINLLRNEAPPTLSSFFPRIELAGFMNYQESFCLNSKYLRQHKVPRPNRVGCHPSWLFPWLPSSGAL